MEVTIRKAVARDAVSIWEIRNASIQLARAQNYRHSSMPSVEGSKRTPLGMEFVKKVVGGIGGWRSGKRESRQQ